jgi:hypothetical protein
MGDLATRAASGLNDISNWVSDNPKMVAAVGVVASLVVLVALAAFGAGGIHSGSSWAQAGKVVGIVDGAVIMGGGVVALARNHFFPDKPCDEQRTPIDLTRAYIAEEDGEPIVTEGEYVRCLPPLTDFPEPRKGD